MYAVGPEDDRNKKVACVTLSSDIKKRKKEERQKKVMEVVKKVISEQAYRKSDKSHEQVFV